jgi:hypothetical protein
MTVQPFLTRLKPLAWGLLPRGPFVQRWFLRAAGRDVAVSATRFSQYLAADRSGEWVAYVVDPLSQARKRIGNSLNAVQLALAFGVL